MKPCKCNSECGSATLPGPVPCNKSCECKPAKITLSTTTIPANLGTDAESEAYAPYPGAHYNKIVHYLANGAVYLYDSNGVYTEVVIPADFDVEEVIKTLEQQMTELYTPAKIGLYVNSVEELEALPATVVPAGEMVQVTKDATHDGVDSLYYWDTAAGMWKYAYATTPYYTKDFINQAIDALQANINNVMNKEMQDVEALQTNINAEVNAREAADNALSERIEEIHNSPDVVDIVETYADLEAYDTSNLHDNDIIRVLRDETHDGASYYYRWNATDKAWVGIGTVGDYYTKQEINAKFTGVNNDITTLTSGLSETNTKVTSLQTSVSTVETDLSALDTKVAAVDNKIGDINSVLDEINGEVPNA